MPLWSDLLARNAVPLSVLGVFWLVSTAVMLYWTAKRQSSPLLLASWVVSLLSAVGLIFCTDVPVLAILVLVVYSAGMVAIGKRCEGAIAEAMIEARLRLVETEFESVDADPKDFPWLDLDWYDAMTRQLQSLGFRRVADREAVHLNKINPGIRYYIRIFLDSENKIWVNLVHQRYVTPTNRAERNYDYRLYICGSELDDETNVVTGNQVGVAMWRDLPNFVSHDFPPDTPFEEILARHREFVEQACQERKIGVAVIDGPEQLRGKGRRDHDRLREEIIRTGLFSREELQQLAEMQGHKEHFLKHSLSKRIFEMSEAKTKELQHRSRARQEAEHV